MYELCPIAHTMIMSFSWLLLGRPVIISQCTVLDPAVAVHDGCQPYTAWRVTGEHEMKNYCSFKRDCYQIRKNYLKICPKKVFLGEKCCFLEDNNTPIHSWYSEVSERWVTLLGTVLCFTSVAASIAVASLLSRFADQKIRQKAVNVLTDFHNWTNHMFTVPKREPFFEGW